MKNSWFEKQYHIDMRCNLAFGQSREILVRTWWKCWKLVKIPSLQPMNHSSNGLLIPDECTYIINWNGTSVCEYFIWCKATAFDPDILLNLMHPRMHSFYVLIEWLQLNHLHLQLPWWPLWFPFALFGHNHCLHNAIS